MLFNQSLIGLEFFTIEIDMGISVNAKFTWNKKNDLSLDEYKTPVSNILFNTQNQPTRANYNKNIRVLVFCFVYSLKNTKTYSMNTKLTLTIEQEVIERAKNYAKDKNRSLSDIIENYLKMLTGAERKPEVKKLNPIVQSLKGSFKMPKEMNYKKELGSRLEEKYL